MRCLTVALSAILMGSLAIFVRNLNLSPLAITFFRLSFGLIYLLPFSRFVRFDVLKNSKVLAVALVSLVTIFFYIASIQLIEIAVSALLLYMAPIYVIVFMLLRGEEVERLSILSLIFALLGLFFLLSPYCTLNFGIVFGVLSGLSYAGYFLLAKEARELASSVEITFATLLISTLILMPVVFNLNLQTVMQNLPWLLGLGLIPTAIPFVLLNYGIKFCKKENAPIIALVEPVSAGIYGYIFFNELLTFKQFFGAILILSSVVLALKSGVEG